MINIINNFLFLLSICLEMTTKKSLDFLIQFDIILIEI